MDAPLSRRLAVARGDEPADLVVRGGKVLSVFTREWLETDVAIVDGWIAGLGDYEGRDEIDASGRWVVPGFIDAHMHLESSKLLVDEFARLVLPFGTTAVVADPHEIANVLGTDGVHWLLDATAGLPLDVYFMASSCVPASDFESPRRRAEPRRPRRAAAPAARDRRRRDDELPRRDQRCAGRAREARPRGARRRPRTRCAGALADGVCGGRHPLGPRGVHRRRGPRAAARGHVAPDPRGLGGAQPAGAPAAARRVRPVSDRVLHGRPRAGAHRGRRPHQLDGARRRRVRHPTRGRARPRRRSARRSGTASRTSAPSHPATTPTCSSCPTSSASCPRPCSSAAVPPRRSPRRRCRTGCATRFGSARSAPRCSASRGRAATRA